MDMSNRTSLIMSEGYYKYVFEEDSGKEDQEEIKDVEIYVEGGEPDVLKISVEGKTGVIRLDVSEVRQLFGWLARNTDLLF